MKFIVSTLFIGQLLLHSALVETNFTRTIRQADDIFRCTLPPYPRHGRWSLLNDQKVYLAGDQIEANKVIKFECDRNYKLTPTLSYVICDEAYDVKKVPECIKLCPPVYSTTTTMFKCVNINKQEINCSEPTDGTYMSYKCLPYYEPPIGYRKNLFCLDGVWDLPTPVCQSMCGIKYNDDVLPLIYGGNISKKVIYPWVSAIYRRYMGEYVNICGGSLISRGVIVTAAHCVTNDYGEVLLKEEFRVGLGKVYRAYNDPRDSSAQYFEIAKIIPFDTFRGAVQRYLGDIALIITKGEVLLSQSVMPVCIQEINTIPNRDIGEIAGWGMQENGTYSEEMRYIKIRFLPRDLCARELVHDSADKYLTADKFCAGYFDKSRNVCKGDNGNGLVFKNPMDNRYYIYGIATLVSLNNSQCNDSRYSIFTEVSRYYEFIDRELVKNQKEDCKLPGYPRNGHWVTENTPMKKPGDIVLTTTILKVICDDGYILSGDGDSLECKESLNMPTCIKLCPPINLVTMENLKCVDRTNREVKCNQATDGTYISYRCQRYYEPSIDFKKNLLCLNGTWRIRRPVCQPICGRKNNDDSVPLIYGGTISQEVIYPWITAVYRLKNEKYTNMCGGSLISRRIILTAAHCVTNTYGDVLPSEIFKVAVGKIYRDYNDSRDPEAQYLDVSQLIVHADYNSARRNYFADIALIITKTLVALSEIVLPVCISDVNSIYLRDGDSGEIAGWGMQGNIIVSDELVYLKIPYKNETLCAQEFDREWASKYNFPDKLCAGFYKKNISLCKGDSGSGLTFRNPRDSRYYVHGIASIAPGNRGQCNIQQNALYTKVAYYQDFIDRELEHRAGDCELPAYPKKGRWVLENGTKKQPGDVVTTTTVLKIICNDGYKLSRKNDLLDCETSFNMPTCNHTSP